MGDITVKWEVLMEQAVKAMLEAHTPVDMVEHIKKTPSRVVAEYCEAFSGTHVNVPQLLRSAVFESVHNQMIHVTDIVFYSRCAHHLLPFFGKAHFAYIPDGRVVGLSKIPRFIDALARRPQIQENLSDNIVDSFQTEVKPRGCGVLIRASHFCMTCRGVKSPEARTVTTSLRGVFSEVGTKTEFLLEAGRKSID